jgi:hypothetical protein
MLLQDLFLACIITMFYAFILKKQSFSSQFPNVKEIMIYTFLLFYPECFTFRYRQVNAESVYKIEILLFGGNL